MFKHLVGTALAATAVAVVPFSALAVNTTPPIEDIGAQYLAETGATAVACSQFNEGVICYGVLDGSVIAGVWADGVFTEFGATAPVGTATTVAAPGTTVAAPVGDVDGAQAFVDMFVAMIEPDLLAICPVVRSSPEMISDLMRETLTENADIIAKAAEYGIPVEDFVDMIVRGYGNRLVVECG